MRNFFQRDPNNAALAVPALPAAADAARGRPRAEGRSSPVQADDALAGPSAPAPGTVLHMLAGPRGAWRAPGGRDDAARGACETRCEVAYAAERMTDLVLVQRAAELTVRIDAVPLYDDPPELPVRQAAQPGDIEFDLAPHVFAPPTEAGDACCGAAAPCDPRAPAPAGRGPAYAGTVKLRVYQSQDGIPFVKSKLRVTVRMLRDDDRLSRRLVGGQLPFVFLFLDAAIPGSSWLVDSSSGIVLRLSLSEDSKWLTVSYEHYDFTGDSYFLIHSMHARLVDRIVSDARAGCRCRSGKECAFARRVSDLLRCQGGASEPIAVPARSACRPIARLPGATDSPLDSVSAQRTPAPPTPEFLAPIDGAFGSLPRASA